VAQAGARARDRRDADVVTVDLLTVDLVTVDKVKGSRR
jgi:hypothetical protein